MKYLALIITTVILTSSKIHIIHRHSSRFIITDFQTPMFTEEWRQKFSRSFEFGLILWENTWKIHSPFYGATIKYWYQTIIDTKSIIFTCYFKDIKPYRTTSYPAFFCTCMYVPDLTKLCILQNNLDGLPVPIDR